MKKVTVELCNQIRTMKGKGFPLREIMSKLGVSKGQCIKYAKDIKCDDGFFDKEWLKVQKEASGVLLKNGYNHIIDLNEISPQSHWDYYCEKSRTKWLIDVTINYQKCALDKIIDTVQGYRHAILFKKDNEWHFIEVKFKDNTLK